MEEILPGFHLNVFRDLHETTNFAGSHIIINAKKDGEEKPPTSPNMLISSP